MKYKYKCPKCSNRDTFFFGKTRFGKQRCMCKKCNKTFVIINIGRKQHCEKSWFELWIKKGYSVEEISKRSKKSKSTVRRIINYWLTKPPEITCDYTRVKYLVIDGTFIIKRIGMFAIMNVSNHHIIYAKYPLKESSTHEVSNTLEELKSKGLNPICAIVDGNINVLKALHYIFPRIKTQRCLTHIQRQTLAWMRHKPEREEYQWLRSICKKVPYIDSHQGKEKWILEYETWCAEYKGSLLTGDKRDPKISDIIKVVSLLDHAIPDMFHYLDDNHIPKSTSCLEGYFSRLKHFRFCHRGLVQSKWPNYFKWFVFLRPK